MAKTMKRISVITLLLTICSFVLYRVTNYSFLVPFTITFGTTAYHFIIRLMVGVGLNSVMQNKANYHKKWYQVSDFEMKLYQKLKVKKWKNKMPTFDMDAFDISKHSWDEIVQATCQSELVHEINIMFSFLPIAASVWFDSFWVFLITSTLGAMYDLLFVMMQRFNRTRILRIQRRSESRV